MWSARDHVDHAPLKAESDVRVKQHFHQWYWTVEEISAFKELLVGRAGDSIRRALPAPDGRVYSVALPRNKCRAEKRSTTPKKGTNTHPAFASGTTGMLGFPPLFFPFLFAVVAVAVISAGIREHGENQSGG
jgi:hypothetical protein